MRAIVIDDSRAVRHILGSMLRELGYEVTDASNGVEALQRIGQSGKPDLALVDWNMPEMNGLEFIKALRSDHSNDDIRLLMVTTENEMRRVAEALAAGANEYVMKPFTKDIILDKLQLMDRPEDQT